MATNVYTTVNTILQIISDLRGESSTNTDAVRIRSVSRANQDFARRKFWTFYLLPDQTTTGTAANDYTVGSATYPMRHKGLMEVFVSSGATTQETERCDLVNYVEYKNKYNANNADLMCYTWYDVANDAWKMHINPAPAATETITYTYYWQPPTLTATTEYVLCPNPKIIALLSLAEIYESEDETDLAVVRKNEAEILTSEIFGLDNAPSVNQILKVPATEGAGFGTY